MPQHAGRGRAVLALAVGIAVGALLMYALLVTGSVPFDPPTMFASSAELSQLNASSVAGKRVDSCAPMHRLDAAAETRRREYQMFLLQDAKQRFQTKMLTWSGGAAIPHRGLETHASAA